MVLRRCPAGRPSTTAAGRRICPPWVLRPQWGWPPAPVTNGRSPSGGTGETAPRPAPGLRPPKWTSLGQPSGLPPILRTRGPAPAGEGLFLPEEVESARAYVCGLGLYELSVNGRKAGDEFLLPGYHCYDFQLEYQTFDLTPLLNQGENAIGWPWLPAGTRET